MGSTGEADRKRRHFNSISPTAVASKKQPFLPISEEKKLDAAVLQFQNQKLVQKLEAQKVEYSTLENKFLQLKEKQKPYDSTLKAVNKSWEALITDLESRSIHTRKSSGQDVGHTPNVKDGPPSYTENAFLSRLMETGATESSSSNNCTEQIKEDREHTVSAKTGNILHNIIVAIDDLWCLKDGLYAAVRKELQNDGSCRQLAELESEVKNLRFAIADVHLNHRSLARELQSHRDIDAKNKAELKRLKGELESAVAELQESNCKLATLKAERDATKGAFFPVLNLGSKHVSGDKVKDKHIDLHEMESALKELLVIPFLLLSYLVKFLKLKVDAMIYLSCQEQASSRLTELKGLHEERIQILQQLSNLQNTLKSVKCISSSKVFLLVRDQLEKSKSEVFLHQDLFEKLQVEKDNLAWREKELSIKNDIADVFQRSLAVANSRASHLGAEIQRQVDDRKRIEAKLEEASREPGRTEIIADFKSLLSSFPEAMSSMQNQLGKYKEAAVDIHSLRADVQSLSSILNRKAKDIENLSVRSTDQVTQMHKLQAMVQDLKDSDGELKLLLEMYRREFTDSSDILEARDSEFKAWAHVQSLKSCLDEHNLELRVKTANEAEAISQQKLAAAEAEIAELRHKLEASKRDKSRLTDSLKAKIEENEAYLSEIESIGQAYDDMQTQNQQLLQQITERDDYNIKLVLEGLRAKQLQDTLLLEKHNMEKEIQQASTTLDFYNMKAARIEDQLRFCSDQVQKLGEERFQKSVSLENTQKRLSDMRRSSHQAKESLEDSQFKIERSRAALLELQIEIERERFKKKRIEEELEVAKRKVVHLQAKTEGNSMIERLQEELREYREILKCSICLDRPKEVVITKCYHLFCNPCVHKVTENRHRKCPVCAASFGANDVKPVYI
ncbi:E3 ubiquitin-protein ligase BRE1-like 1 [Gossypium arboreum]|uniref:E3 ubiquitin protein ligase n=1 Tax=Gossypium arboreum TaxID=29729 RepID=A0A0B0PS68_GOSAR|nr:E3 ubiquitin-protein ligase BRE1-like 1 [Gossypium arboreum]